jgi:hypothetical protein
MGTPFDLNSFLQNFSQQKDNLQDLLNKLTTNLSDNINTITNQPQPSYVPSQQPNPNYAYFLNPQIPTPPPTVQSQLSNTLQLLENSINTQQRVAQNPYNGYSITQDPLQSLLSSNALGTPAIGTLQQALNEQIETLKSSIATKAQHLLQNQNTHANNR